MTFITVARAPVMVAACSMIACCLAFVIASSAHSISVVPSHTTCMTTPMSAAVATATAATFGVGRTHRG